MCILHCENSIFIILLHVVHLYKCFTWLGVNKHVVEPIEMHRYLICLHVLHTVKVQSHFLWLAVSHSIVRLREFGTELSPYHLSYSRSRQEFKQMTLLLTFIIRKIKLSVFTPGVQLKCISLRILCPVAVYL